MTEPIYPPVRVLPETRKRVGMIREESWTLGGIRSRCKAGTRPKALFRLLVLSYTALRGISSVSLLQQDHVAAVEHLVAVVMAEYLFDLMGANAADLQDLVGAVVGDAAGDAVAFRVDDGDRLPALE
jgi:hypothetical protein